jgi:hypothetical protein
MTKIARLADPSQAQAEINKLTEALETVRELREYDRKEIARLRALLDKNKIEWKL